MSSLIKMTFLKNCLRINCFLLKYYLYIFFCFLLFESLREKLCNLKELEVDSLPNILIETDADLKAVENMKKQLVLVSKVKTFHY